MAGEKKLDNEERVCQVLMLFSTSSATGKTVLATNFAAYLAAAGYKVCLLDYDLQFGDVTSYLQLKPQKTIFDYSQAPEDANALNFLTSTELGFEVLAGPNEVDEGFIIEAETTAKAVDDLIPYYDYLIIDTATGFSNINIPLFDKTAVVYIPCVVDFLPSIKNLKLGIDTLSRLQVHSDNIRLILNRNNADTEISVSDVEGLIGRPFDYLVANDYMGVMNSVKSAKPIILTEQDNKVANDLAALLEKELGGGEEEEESSGISGWFGSLWK